METANAAPRPVSAGVPITTIVFVAILILFWGVQGIAALDRAWEHDFLNIYTGSQLAREGQFSLLHDREAQRRVQQQLVPTVGELIPFVRPHFYAFALAPLSSLSYRQAFWSWIAAHTILLLACWVWAARRFGSDALIFGALFFPTAAGIANGQDCVVMLIIAMASFRLAERDRWLLSGLVLGLGLIKFHLLLLTPAAMLIQKRYRMLGGFCLTGLSAAIVSLVLGGWMGVRSYIDLLLAKDLPRLSPAPERMVNIHSLPANFGIDQPVVAAMLFAAVAAVMICGVRAAPLWRWFSVMLLGSTLAAPHVYAYDQSLLLLPVWLALFLSRDQITRTTAVVMATPLAFYGLSIGPPWSVAPALVSVGFFLALVRESVKEHRANALEAAPSCV
jgi:hypothetical protein